MSMKRSLQGVLAIALCGLSFSGYLSYRELFASSPPADSCPSPGAAGTALGYPACVYGFFMYLAIAGIAAAGLRGSAGLSGRQLRREPERPLTEPGI